MKFIFLLLLPFNLFSQSIKIEKTNANNIKAKFTENKLTLVYFWGTWCHPCVDDVENIITLSKKFKDVKLISVNDPLSNKIGISKILLKYNYPDTLSYILDDKLYNKSATNNIKKFTKEFCDSCAKESGEFIFAGVYLFDKKGKLLFYNKSFEYSEELLAVLLKL